MNQATPPTQAGIVIGTAAISEVQPVPAAPREPGPYDDIQFVTIDARSTKDIDDAVHVSHAEDGGVRIVVAIADPTGLVKPGSTEDEEARLLGATAYARDLAIKKMLPGRISEHLASLIAGQPRRVMVLDICLEADLTPRSFNVKMCSIVVYRRLSYEDIPRILVDENDELRPMLALASTVSRMLMDKRRKSGALALYDLARMVLTDEEGRLIQLYSVDEVVGHIVVQELMVLSNACLAGWLAEHDIPAIFRNHVPKLAAPPVAELANTIAAWLAAGALDVETARGNFLAIAGKATYASTVSGHYALALPCYVHATSPLRRYADLVNMRQVKAFLRKQPFPLSFEQIGPMATELTEALERRKDERSEGFKDAVNRVAQRALDNDRLSRLADHEIAQAIKLARGAGEMPQNLVDELVRRLDASIVTDKVTDCLMLELPLDLWQADLKAAFGRWVSQQPTRAMHLLVHGHQTGYFANVSITATGEGTSFHGLAVITMTDGSQVTASGAASRKREAEQEAALRAVGIALQLGLADVALLTAPVPGAVKGNPKGALMELCQKHAWPALAFNVTGSGPSHMMIFAATATLQAGGRTLTASTQRGANKKDAESIVSADLLAQAKALLGVPSKVKAPSAPAAQTAAAVVPVAAVKRPLGAGGTHPNPIGALMEMAQKKKLRAPEFEVVSVSDVPPLFRATCTTFVGTPEASIGEATTKQEAKKRAAQASLDKLAQ